MVPVPAMASVERAFCRSAPWRAVAARVVLPWALDGATLRGQVLELGAGSGAMAAGMARSHPAATIVATDVDPLMVAAADSALADVANARARVADGTSLPLPDASFDVVVSFLMLHHVVSWRPMLSEASRVLRPGGVLLGYDLDDTALARALHRLDRSPHVLVRRRDVRAELLEVGFAPVAVRPAFAGQLYRFVAHKPA